MTFVCRFLFVACAALGAVACEPSDEMSYRVGVGGQYEGRAVCHPVAGAVPDQLDCVVHRNSDGEQILKGIYHLDAGGDPRISERFVIGIRPYTPNLAIYISEGRDRVSDRQTTSAGATLLCHVLGMAGATTVQCVAEPPRAGEQGVIRIHNPAFPECDLLARVSERLVRMMLRSTCDPDPWRATYQMLERNFEGSKTWYLDRTG